MKALLGLAASRGLRMTRMKAVKLLYLADLRSVEKDGVTGSGVLWQWRDFGPFSDDWYSIERAMADSGEITVAEVHNWFVGKSEFRLSAPAVSLAVMGSADRFIEYLNVVLAEHGALSATELKDLTYRTAPMQEAQAEGERNVLLDMGDTPPVPVATATLQRFQQMLDDHADDDVPAPRGCSEEVLNPLRAARTQANRILLDHSL